MIEYKDWTYLYPPRAEQKITADRIGEYEKLGYYGQPKMNGACAVLFLKGSGGNPISLLYNRHGEKLTNSKDLGFADLYRGTGWMVLAGEYMNKNCKATNGEPFNHKFVIWDILVYNGVVQLFTFQQRLDLLNKLYGAEPTMLMSREGVTKEDSLYQITDDVFRVATFVQGLEAMYEQLIKTDMIEGYVLKRPTGKLVMPSRATANKGWQVKVRKPTKNYKH